MISLRIRFVTSYKSCFHLLTRFSSCLFSSLYLLSISDLYLNLSCCFHLVSLLNTLFYHLNWAEIAALEGPNIWLNSMQNRTSAELDRTGKIWGRGVRRGGDIILVKGTPHYQINIHSFVIVQFIQLVFVPHTAFIHWSLPLHFISI